MRFVDDAEVILEGSLLAECILMRWACAAEITQTVTAIHIPDASLQISKNAPLFQMTRTERVLCEFPTKDV